MPVTRNPALNNNTSTAPTNVNSSTNPTSTIPGTTSFSFHPTEATSPTSDVPVLPAYTQLFREDGSRLADEGEDLPQYPGRGRLSLSHARGSITRDLGLSSGTVGSNSLNVPTSPTNRISPESVVDEALMLNNDGQGGNQNEMDETQRELEELNSEMESEVEGRSPRHQRLNQDDGNIEEDSGNEGIFSGVNDEVVESLDADGLEEGGMTGLDD